MQKHTRCWIVGAGAVGSVLAAILHQNQTAETCLVGSSVHAEEIQKKGLFFKSLITSHQRFP